MRDLKQASARDPIQDTDVQRGGDQDAALEITDVERRAFGHESIRVAEDRIVVSCGLGLEVREHAVEVVPGFHRRIERARGIAESFDQAQTHALFKGFGARRMQFLRDQDQAVFRGPRFFAEAGQARGTAGENEPKIHFFAGVFRAGVKGVARAQDLAFDLAEGGIEREPAKRTGALEACEVRFDFAEFPAVRPQNFVQAIAIQKPPVQKGDARRVMEGVINEDDHGALGWAEVYHELMLDSYESLMPKVEGGRPLRALPAGFDAQALEEMESLLETLGVDRLGRVLVTLKRINPATYITQGKVEELKLQAEGLGADLVVVDGELSPNQMRNLEKAVGKPVLDRAGVILEIFSRHARTK